MDNFLDRWKRLLEAAGAKNESALARVLGIKPPSVSRAKEREMIPAAWIDKICLSCKISADWLLFGIGNKTLGEEKSAKVVSKLDPNYLELEAKVAELEKKLIASQEETIKAYKLATAHMKPDTDTLQKPEPQKVENIPATQKTYPNVLVEENS